MIQSHRTAVSIVSHALVIAYNVLIAHTVPTLKGSVFKARRKELGLQANSDWGSREP